ncbi:MAG: (Fe-S)-binding protein [Desulfurococcaceae archaeon]|nr:(Fe-S)-binding protein [Desulfurococcaceae archaeon]
MARLRLDFEVRDRVMKHSYGTLSLCYQCGVCTASCLISPGISVRRIIREAQIGVVTREDSWKCLTCRYCETTCPRGVRIADVILGGRIVLYERKVAPEKLVDTLWRVYETGNPLGSPRRERGVWARGLSVESGGDVLLYTCCMNAYDRRLQKVTRSLVEVLARAGVRVTYAWDGEGCCGDIVYSVGEEYFLEELAQGNVEVMERFKPTLIVVTSPHAYNMLVNVYPRYKAKPPAPVVHYTQLLAELITSGRLKPGRLDAKVTYHDPCYLGRWNNVYEEPRTILQHVEGLKLVEMEHNRSNSLCCGGGGGAFWSENIEARSVTRRRLREATATESQAMVTACPYCIRMFEDELKISKYPLVVSDVVEVLASTLR